MLWSIILVAKSAVRYTPQKKIVLRTCCLFKELIENQKMLPVVDRHYSFENITEAHRYVETGHKVGSAIVTL